MDTKDGHSKTDTGGNYESRASDTDRERAYGAGDESKEGISNATSASLNTDYPYFTEAEHKHLTSLTLDAYGQKYRRIGYYASIEQPHLGEAGAEALRAKEAEPFDRRLAECNALLAKSQQFFSDQLSSIDTQLEKERENARLFIAEEQPRLRAELEQLEAEIIRAETELTALRKELAVQKETLSKGRFEKLKGELTQIGEFAEKYREKVKDSLGKHTPESTTAYHNWLVSWRTRVEKNQEEVSSRLHNLAAAGFSLDERASYRYFYALFGLLATVIAGWFFSIYTGKDSFPNASTDGQRAFDSQSLVSILVKAFLEYASRLGGVRFTLYGLGAITVITGLVILFDRLNIWTIKKRNEQLGISAENTKSALQKSQVQIASDFEQPDAFFKFNLQAGSWLELWFKLAPALVIILPVLSVVGFLIRNSPKPVEGNPDLYKEYFYPFYNALYGTWIALALAGIFYIYLTRKLEKPVDELKTSRWPGIGLLLVAFFSFLLLLGVDYVVEAIKIQQVALVGFGFMSVVAGVCIGYYLRVSSLLHSQQLCQEEILVINQALSRHESMGRVELLRAEVDAVLGALQNYNRNTATITDLSYAFEIPKYYQEVETRILEQVSQEKAAAAPKPPVGKWQAFWGFWRSFWDGLRGKEREKMAEEPIRHAKHTWVHTAVKPPVAWKVSDQSLFPVLVAEIDLKYEDYYAKQARKEQILHELLGPHVAPRTLLSRLYAQIALLEHKKKPIIAEEASLCRSYERQYRIIQQEKEEALLQLAEGYFAHQWEIKPNSSL